MELYRWYNIPGFNGYQINKQTREIRSFKNFKADPYHIMSIDKNGNVTLSADDGKKVRKSPIYFYDLTFNQGHQLEPAPDIGIYMGGRQRMAKQQSKPIQMDFTKFVTK